MSATGLNDNRNWREIQELRAEVRKLQMQQSWLLTALSQLSQVLYTNGTLSEEEAVAMISVMKNAK